MLRCLKVCRSLWGHVVEFLDPSFPTVSGPIPTVCNSMMIATGVWKILELIAIHIRHSKDVVHMINICRA